jgi:tRNA-2-methylthio-N6-dimethylallyladenosine synthase
MAAGYDSERMGDASRRLSTVDTVEADLVLINTCHIREKAAEKVYSQLGRLAKLKRQRNAEGGDLMVAVAGLCCPGRRSGNHPPRAGCRCRHRPADLSPPARGVGAGRATARARSSRPSFPPKTSSTDLNAPEKAIRARGVAAFLTVQEGCDKFCTFCVVPYTRGAEVSRPSTGSSPRPNAWPRPGVREITLLGQNVNAWHGKGADGPNGVSASCSTAWRRSMASTVSATPPATRATWMTH